MDNRELLNDAEEGARLVVEGHLARLWTALPGLVAAVNLTAQTVSVQPAIRGEITDSRGIKQPVTMPLLVDVPIVWPRAGGFAVTFPVAVGDEVLVVFSARCIDAWWQNGGIGNPAESRTHDLSDGFAILAPTSQPKALANVQTDGMELRDELRTTFIKLMPGTILIQGNVTITGNVTHLGNVAQTGNLVVTGVVQNNAKVIGSTHTHSGVQTGGGNTSIPN